MKPLALSIVCISILLFCLQACELFDKAANKKDGLPPASQEGKNTFGCLVNGKLWLPKGNVSGVSNLDASYDPSSANGAFGLDAYRISDTEYTNIYIYT